MSELPVILLKNGLFAWKVRPSEAVVAGSGGILGAIFGAAFRAIDRMPHDPHGLLQYLHVQLFETDNARRRANNVFGRMWNRMSGANGDFIEVSGVHLKQVLELAGQDVPKGLSAGGKYLLRHDVARSAYDLLRAELG